MRAFQVLPVVLLLAGSTQAQEPPPVYPPPQYFMPSPMQAQIQSLEHSGRRKLIGGNTLLATGAAVALTGAGLAFASLFVDNGHCESGKCGNAALAAGGGTMALLGVAAIIPGSFMRSDGKRDLAMAGDLRGRFAWSLQPKVSTQGALGVLKVKF
jgi:hypothetical protein